MKQFLLALFLFAVPFMANAQDEEKDAGVLKSEIKNLEKLVKDEEKELVKLEKSLNESRPEAEQAMRDAANIDSMSTMKKAAFEAFKYDEKAKEYKTLSKELKSWEKKAAKSEKSIAKNEAGSKALISTTENLNIAQNRAQSELKAAREVTSKHTKMDTKNHQAMLEGKVEASPGGLETARAAEDARLRAEAVQKELKKNDKALSKSQGKLSALQANVKDQEKIKDKAVEETVKLKERTENLRKDLGSMDPKVVTKELNELQKQASEAKLLHEKLALEIAQTDKIIAEKHDLIEQKKQAVREKESILLKK